MPKGKGKMPTRDERDQIVANAIALISKGMSIGKVRQALKKTYGFTTRTAENYLSRARKDILKAADRTEDDFRAEAFAFLEGLRGDEKLDAHARLRAQEQISDLMALNKPKKIALTNRDGTGPGRLVVETSKLDAMTTDQLAAVESALAAMEVT